MEFVKVMSQFMRLCDSYSYCDDCPVFRSGFSCESDHMGYSKTGAKELEHIIMSWATEHKEPVYPTWEEWLQSVGVMESSEGLLRHIQGQLLIDGIPAHAVPTSKVLQPMDADIAQKLGIEPKEE